MDLKKLTDQVAALSNEVAHFIRTEAAGFDTGDVETKSHNNLVSYVDKQAEQRFVAGLKELLPEAGFIAEEGTGERKAGLNWVIDPLDGTTNFVHGLPCYCTSVALVEGTDILLGVVLEVSRNECFTAWKGGGAWLNGQPIHVSRETELQGCLVATGFPYDDFGMATAYIELLLELMQRTRGIRRWGSAAADLAYVACGRYDLFYEYGLNSWDVAAGVLLVREAGGQASAFNPGKDLLFDGEILASNGAVHQEILEAIHWYWQQRKKA